MMKIGFSSLVCPRWGLEEIVVKAAAHGFDGVELRGLRGELHLPVVSELAANPKAVSEFFAEKKVELVCLGSSVTLESKKLREVAKQKAVLEEYVELASRLRCPNVRIFVGEVPRRDNRRRALSRVAEALSGLTSLLSRWKVTLLVENGGDFPGSDDLWFLIDSVSHPRVRCCWNPCTGRQALERPTVSMPRLGFRIGMVHVCDAEFSDDGVLTAYKPIGQGDAEVGHQIDLLKGLAFDRYVIFEWPKLWIESLPEPESVLPEAAGFLRERINARQPVLSAYKGDKNAPRWAARSSVTPSRVGA